MINKAYRGVAGNDDFVRVDAQPPGSSKLNISATSSYAKISA